MSDLVVPHTGEVIGELDVLPSVDLADHFDRARDMERQLAEFRTRLGDELIRRLDHRRHWTLREGPFEIEAPSDQKVLQVDVDGLRQRLAELVGAGLLDPAAATAAVKRKTTYTHSVAGVKALLKNEGLAERLGDVVCEVDNERRRVTVKRH